MLEDTRASSCFIYVTLKSWSSRKLLGPCYVRLAFLCSAVQGLSEHRNTKDGTNSFGDQNINLCIREICGVYEGGERCAQGFGGEA
jgi:hypothetical protein